MVCTIRTQVPHHLHCFQPWVSTLTPASWPRFLQIASSAGSSRHVPKEFGLHVPHGFEQPILHLGEA
jgi:hypothetical protein